MPTKLSNMFKRHLHACLSQPSCERAHVIAIACHQHVLLRRVLNRPTCIYFLIYIYIYIYIQIQIDRQIDRQIEIYASGDAGEHPGGDGVHRVHGRGRPERGALRATCLSLLLLLSLSLSLSLASLLFILINNIIVVYVKPLGYLSLQSYLSE